jgi:cyclase
MDHDGTKAGFACDLTSRISNMLNIPIIASGGAGKESDFVDVFTEGKADAALAASIFHFNEISIPTLKHYLRDQQIPVRL